MQEHKRFATVMLAKCQQSKRSFGIRVEKKQEIWYCTWTFKINEKAASNEGYDDTVVSGKMSMDEEYPGCPHCGAMAWFSCGKCKKITCTNSTATKATCAWCGNLCTLRAAEKFDLRGGGY
jgi:hypothetical protein